MLDTTAARSGAGAYQQLRFEQGRRNWRRRVLPPVRLVLLLIAGPCLAYEFWNPSPLNFMAGFGFGACAAIYLWARDEVPEHVRRHGDGAAGERATAEALAPLLRDGWYVEHDIDTGRGNRDHVAVGPGGVFLIDSKRPSGQVKIVDGAVWVERVDDPSDSYNLGKYASGLRREACALHEEIRERSGISTWVAPVVVLWNRFDAEIAQLDGIVYVHGGKLDEWLRSQRPRLSAEVVRQIREHVGGQ